MSAAARAATAAAAAAAAATVGAAGMKVHNAFPPLSCLAVLTSPT